MIKEWLDSNPVTIEDGLRHDKWLTMMWPRLRLLRELLADDGSIWITVDDNEGHRLRQMMDEIFGEDNFVATVIWEKADSPKGTAEYFSEDHDYLYVYAKSKPFFRLGVMPRTPEMEARYTNPDNDPRGPWLRSDLSARNFYSEGLYSVTTPSGRVIPGPTQGRYWSTSKEKFLALDKDNRIYWGKDANSMPMLKRFLSEVKDGVVPQTIWSWESAGSNRHSKSELMEIMQFSDPSKVFVTPKPVKLLKRILTLIGKPDALVLDSFAGSATIAHAVLSQNALDGGNRRFILVEMEDYADSLTAERVRRVINGYTFTGTQKEELLREKLSWSKLQKPDVLLKKVQSFENMDGHRYGRIRKEVKDGELIVTGEQRVQERAEGLGGEFTYCELGDPIELDKLLTGETLPSFEALGSVLFHMATNQAFDAGALELPALGQDGLGYLGEAPGFHVWLIYHPDLDFLKSPKAALTMATAKAMHEAKPDKRHLVYAPARFVSQKLLNEEQVPVEFAPLPYGLYRMELVG